MADRQEEIAEQQERQLHQGNLTGGPTSSNSPETLKYIAEPEDIDSPADGLDWINSKSTSTANLDQSDVRSKEWVLEYHREFSQMDRPPVYGISGHLRAFVYDDPDEFKKPLVPQEQQEAEGYMEIGKEASTRSKDGWATEQSTSIRKESYVHDDKRKNSGGGLLGRFRG